MFDNVKQMFYNILTLESEMEGKMENLTKLTEEQKKEVLSKVWDSHMTEYIASRTDYYKTNDGLVIEIEKSNKLSIEKEFWYDDETDAPAINFENFLAHNDAVFERYKHLCEKSEKEYEHFYFAQQYSKPSKIVCVVVFDNWAEEFRKQYNIRELTKEEKADYLLILKERNDQYLERLKKYFKRYGDKITTHGYWRDR